jgi:peptidoglycan hydrolase-like protein with peptidoglycan-binding domain
MKSYATKLMVFPIAIAIVLLAAPWQRPQPASASCGLLLDIISFGITAATDACAPFGSSDTGCPLANATVRATQSSHSYDYFLGGSCGAIQVSAGIDTTTKDVREKLSGNGRTISAIWSCLDDPWTYADQPPACSRKTMSVTGNAQGVDTGTLANATFPLSAAMLDSSARQTLRTQLQAALKPTPIPITAVGISSSSSILSQCAACSAIFGALGTPTPTPAPPTPTPTPQPASTPVYHAPSIVSGWPELSQGTQGEAVKTLQYLLEASGGSLPQFGVDGKFGPETRAAVIAYQQSQGLKQDGIVGPQTWNAILPWVQLGSTGPAVAAVQSQLLSRGVDLVIGGDFGGQMDALVRAYQQSAGLYVDGQVGPQTWQALLTGQ